MGAKADGATRTRQSKRPAALSSEDVAALNRKVTGRAARVTRKKGRRKKRRLYPESVPPGMVHEVFDVASADDEARSAADFEEARARHDGQPLWSKPPPPPPRPSARPASDDDDDDDDALELDADELEEDDESDSGARGASQLTPAGMAIATRARSAKPVAWLLIGAAALGLGLVLGMRDRPSRPVAQAQAAAIQRTSPEADRVASERILIPLPEPTPNAVLPSEPPPELVSAEASASPSSTAGEVAVSNAPVAPSPDSEPLSPFDSEAASVAITEAFARAKACRGPNDPAGEVTGTLTYAPSGRVTTATVSGIYAGTSVGGCIAATLRGARVPPFSGEHLTVKRTVRLE